MLPHVPGSFPPFLVVSHPYWCYSVLLINLPTPTQDSNLNKEHAHAAVMLRDLYSQSHSDRQAFPSDRIVSTNKGCASGGCQEAKRSVLMRANISDNPPFFFFFKLIIVVIIVHIWSLISILCEPVDDVLVILTKTPICSFREIKVRLNSES